MFLVFSLPLCSASILLPSTTPTLSFLMFYLFSQILCDLLSSVLQGTGHQRSWAQCPVLIFVSLHLCLLLGTWASPGHHLHLLPGKEAPMGTNFGQPRTEGFWGRRKLMDLKPQSVSWMSSCVYMNLGTRMHTHTYARTHTDTFFTWDLRQNYRSFHIEKMLPA